MWVANFALFICEYPSVRTILRIRDLPETSVDFLGWREVG